MTRNASEPTPRHRLSTRESTRILCQVLALPTAPFAETCVLKFILDFVAERASLKLREDAAGNLLVHYRKGQRPLPRPPCLAAHTDHPGFVAERMASSKKLVAVWRGGVQPAYFPRSRVRFFTDGGWVRGRVTSMNTARRRERTVVKSAVIEIAGPVAPGSPGMWDFPDPVIRNDRIHARAIDDLAGVAAMLASMHHLDKHRPTGEAYFLFTRAEEVGFVGAMAACRHKTIPPRCVVVAIETSAERPNARIGDGPILRVGDKMTTFTSTATAYAGRIAAELAARSKRFLYQRKLMDGGTCESSAYCALGYDATGICVALGHYHNMNTRTRKLAPEYISLNDFHALTQWFVALATTRHRYAPRDTTLEAMLVRIRREYNPLLRRTAPRVE